MSYLKGLADKVNAAEAKSNFNLQEIDIDKLIPSEKNYFGIREVEELAESIKESGLLHNLVVRRTPKGYEILSGERRYRALKMLDYKKVPCQVRSIQDLDSEVLLIKANTEHRELTHIEKMKSIERLKEIYHEKRALGEDVKGKTRDVIGKDLGLSGIQVGRYMKVDKKLDNGLKDMLNEGDITLTEAVTLSNLDREEQKEMYEKIKDMPKEELKVEKNILIEGIKQPVDNPQDVDLVTEVSTKSVDKLNEYLSKFRNVLKKDDKPVIITSLDGIVAHTECKNITDSVRYPGYLEVKLYGDGYMYLELKEFTKIKNIRMQGMTLNPKHGYRINDGIFLWAKRWRE